MIEQTLTPERARALLHYDPETGVLTWKERLRSDFETLRGFKIWNGRYAGKSAGYTDQYGYVTLAIGNRHYSAHRIIWLMVYGVLPDQVDHENHVRNDNRLFNLKEADDASNRKNMKMHRTNTSGVVGVTWDRKHSKWRAQIGVANRVKTLGVFADKAVAIARRKSAEIEFGFHPNHGRAEKL